MREGNVQANGIRFAYLEEGEGPLVLLVHGYPDNAHTWSRQMPEIAAAGYRVVAPFTRGYPPTEIPDGGWYDVGTLATDLARLIEALGDGEPAFVVGHDWGAGATYTLLAAHPELVRRAVTLAIPHPVLIARSFTNPYAIHRAFHWWFFQVPHLPEAAVRARDFGMIDYFWKLWSPGLDDPDHVAGIKRMFATPGAVEASLGYYRAMFDPERKDPALEDVRATLSRPIEVPTMTVIGSQDLGRSDALEAQRDHFSGPLRLEVLDDCGHFLHRERPKDVTELILDWFAGAGA